MDALEVKAQKDKDQLSAYRGYISICESQIMQLMEQTIDMRIREKELKISMLSYTKYLIDREAYVGIQHVEVALQLDSEIEELKDEDARLHGRTTLLKVCLDNVKANFI